MNIVKQLWLQYWWAGLIISAAYSVFSIWWTWRTERRLTRIMLAADEVDAFLDKTPTIKTKAASRWEP